MLKRPPIMAKIIVTVLNPVTKEEKNSKTSKIPNPNMPAYVVTLLKILLRNITMMFTS